MYTFRLAVLVFNVSTCRFAFDARQRKQTEDMKNDSVLFLMKPKRIISKGKGQKWTAEQFTIPTIIT